MSAEPDRPVRVSTLELFFDLVFVFTITQLTGLLVEGGDAEAIAQVVVMLAVLWWMYDGVSLSASAAIPLGTEVAATAQMGALTAIVAVALVLE